MADNIWSAEALEGMTPAKRHAIFESSLVDSLDGVPPAFLERVRGRLRERIADADPSGG